MIEVISNSTPKAKKQHSCCACNAILEYGSEYVPEMTYSEKRHFVKARKDGFKIQKGEIYDLQVNKFDGIIRSSRCKTGMADIAHRLGVWDDIL